MSILTRRHLLGLSGFGVLSLAFGCGFRMQSVRLDVHRIGRLYLDAEHDESGVDLQLRRALERRGVVLVAEQGLADSRLVLHSAQFSRGLLTLGSDSRAREFELVLRVTLSAGATAATGWHLAEREEVVRRDFLYDERQVLGKSREEERLQEEMRQEMANRLVRLLAWAVTEPRSLLAG